MEDKVMIFQGSSFVMEGVKNLVVKKHNLPVTKIAEELMEIHAGQYQVERPEFATPVQDMKRSFFQDEFRYFDPKILRSNETIPRAKNPFQDAIVFVVGGGNYIEYQNLSDYAQSRSNPGQVLTKFSNFCHPIW